MILNRFSSVYSFVSSMLERLPEIKETNQYSKNRDYDWNMGVNFEDAAVKAIAGDPAIASLANEAISSLQLQTSEVVRKRNVSHFSGSRVSVPSYLSGNPRAMVRREAQPVSGQEITIFAAISANAIFTGQEMLGRGCAILALLETLQAQGVAINLSLYVDHTGRGNQLLITTIDVDTRPLDLSTAAFAIAHPGFVRSFCFPANAVLGGFRGVSGSQGFGRYLSPETYEYQLKAALGVKPGDIFIPRVLRGDPLISNPVAWIQERIKQISSL